MLLNAVKTFSYPYIHSYGVLCPPATEYSEGAAVLGTTLFFAPGLSYIPFLGSCFSLSWSTPYLMNHTVKYLPENEYMEITFFSILHACLKMFI